jgi:ABC-2 type transport system ATP-binding protein
MPAITVSNLVKNYGSVPAVAGVSFEVQDGEVFALLGPNGAGKTTTVEILEGYRDRSSGTVDVLGHDPAVGGTPFRDRIGIVLQQTGIDPAITVREALVLFSKIYSRHLDPDELIELVGLDDKADARIKTLSGGQQRRVDLALALVGDPDLVFLDEPTTGFDPSARRKAWDLVEGLSSLGKTIILTTHYLDEAQHLADRIAVLSGGRIVAEGTPEQLGADSGESTIAFGLPEGLTVTDLPGLASDYRPAGRSITLRSTDPTRDLHALTSWALDRGMTLEHLVVQRPSLEDVYLEIVDSQPDEGPS